MPTVSVLQVLRMNTHTNGSDCTKHGSITFLRSELQNSCLKTTFGVQADNLWHETWYRTLESCMKRIINGPYLLEHHEPGCYEESRTVWDVFGSVSVLISCTGVSRRQGYLTHNMQSGDWPRSRIFNVVSLPVPLCIYSYFNWGDVKWWILTRG